MPPGVRPSRTSPGAEISDAAGASDHRLHAPTGCVAAAILTPNDGHTAAQTRDKPCLIGEDGSIMDSVAITIRIDRSTSRTLRVQPPDRPLTIPAKALLA